MRILFVNDLAPEEGWGAELHLTRLAEGLRAAGDDVDIFAGRIRHHGAGRVLDVWDPLARRAVARAARSFGANVVHHHNVLRELSASVLGAPSGIATVLTVHDHRIFGMPDAAAGRVRLAAEVLKARFDLAVARRRVDIAVGVSDEIARRLHDAGFPHVGVLPAFAPAPDVRAVPVGDCHDVVFAGRITREKGIDVLVRAFESASARHPEARLVIVGDGPARAALEQVVRPPGERTEFLGRVPFPRVLEAMNRARVLVAPSTTPEGAGLTVIEAALLGRPSIVSDHAALREPVDASGGGIVVAPGSVEELAAALDRLLSDAGLAARLGDAARRSALDRHTTDAAVATMRSIYRRTRELAAERRRAPRRNQTRSARR